jgi:hypothetical protein
MGLSYEEKGLTVSASRIFNPGRRGQGCPIAGQASERRGKLKIFAARLPWKK